MSTPGPAQAPRILRHGRVELAVWTLRADGNSRPLLLLHGLGEATPGAVPAAVAAWPGPVLGLDFTGHGASSIPTGGGYYCEVLMADVDAVIEDVGPVTVVGRGLGGYVGLLIAGARPADVRGAVILDGPGLAGGGPAPGTTMPILPVGVPAARTPDPLALVELSRDVRPPDYARSFAWQASALSGLDAAVAVAATNRPPWLAEVVQQPGVIETTLAGALSTYPR